MEEIKFIAPAGGLGGGIPPQALDDAMANRPDFIACDAGTTDAGPFSLGSGRPAYPREAVKFDLGMILRAGRKAGIPVLIGSAGTAGGDAHVDWALDIAQEIAAESGLKVRAAVIYSEQAKGYVKGLLQKKRLMALDPAPPISESAIDRSQRIVGMMGVEQLQEALKGGAEFILAGRCSDSALFAALPIMRGFPAGLAWHAGKVLECGTCVCENMHKRGVIFCTLRHDHAIIRPFGEKLRCTPQSVAAHSFYESADPYLHKECSGTLDLSNSTFTAVDDISVRISGSDFIPAETYTVKLESAELVGYQSIIIGGVRDPLIIGQLDSWLAVVREKANASIGKLLGDRLSSEMYRIIFHIYGRNAVMGDAEPLKNAISHEVGIVVEATAPTQELATKVAELCRQPLLHTPIPEWKGAITGFACLHNPAFLERGPVYRFSLNHVACPASPMEMFRLKWTDLGAKS